MKTCYVTDFVETKKLSLKTKKEQDENRLKETTLEAKNEIEPKNRLGPRTVSAYLTGTH